MRILTLSISLKKENLVKSTWICLCPWNGCILFLRPRLWDESHHQPPEEVIQTLWICLQKDFYSQCILFLYPWLAKLSPANSTPIILKTAKQVQFFNYPNLKHSHINGGTVIAGNSLSVLICKLTGPRLFSLRFQGYFVAMKQVLWFDVRECSSIWTCNLISKV